MKYIVNVHNCHNYLNEDGGVRFSIQGLHGGVRFSIQSSTRLFLDCIVEEAHKSISKGERKKWICINAKKTGGDVHVK